jgi:hypothetical protein
MTWRTKVVLVLLAPPIAMAVLLAVRPANKARATAETTRRVLRDQGFKLEFKDFQRTDSSQHSSTLDLIVEASYACPHLHDQWAPKLMQQVGSNAVVVAWSQANLEDGGTDDDWAGLRTSLGEGRVKLDQACAAILAGPIRCDLGVLWNGELMNINVGSFKTLSLSLTSRTMLELHDGNREAAWTNLMALTRLVTAWQVEPVELSHMVRMALLNIARMTTWQAMQTNFWTDAQLAALQSEWESLDLFSELPETAALAGANAVMMCRLAREQELSTETLRREVSELLRSPQAVWHDAVSRYRDFVYRTQGSYEDENALMLYYREREGEMKHAIGAHSWAEMRYFPGVTNRPPLPANPGSRKLGNLMSGRVTSQSLLSLPLGRAATSESIRRLLVTALALERYRLQKGAYPQSLSDLAPSLPAVSTTDFSDGKPLRYQVTRDGHFVLYSIGLDCMDQGGDLRPVKYWHQDQGVRSYTRGPEADLVWPRPASRLEVEAQETIDRARREFEDALRAAAMQHDPKQIEEIRKKYPREFEEKMGEATGSPPPAATLTNPERVSE